MNNREYSNRFWRVAFTYTNQNRPVEHINRLFRFFHPTTRN